MKRITQKLMSVMLLSIFALLPPTMRGETVTKTWNFKNKATEIGKTSLTNSGVIASTNNGSNVYYPRELNDYLLGRFAFHALRACLEDSFCLLFTERRLSKTE